MYGTVTSTASLVNKWTDMDHEARVEQLEIEKDDLDNLIKEVRSRIEILEQKVFDHSSEELELTATKRLHEELSLLVSDLGQSLSRSEAPPRCSVAETQDSSDSSIRLKSRCAAVWESSSKSDNVGQNFMGSEAFDFSYLNESNLISSPSSVSSSTLESIVSSEATATTVFPACQLKKALPTARSCRRGRRGHGERVFRNSDGVYPNLNNADSKSSTVAPVVVQESTKTVNQTNCASAHTDSKPDVACNDSKPVTSLQVGLPVSDTTSSGIGTDESSKSAQSSTGSTGYLGVSKTETTTTTCGAPIPEPCSSASRIRIKLACNHEYDSDSTNFVQLLQTCQQCFESNIDDSIQDPFSDEADFLIPDAVLKTWRHFLLDMVAEAGKRSIIEASQFPKFKNVFEHCRMVAPPTSEQFISEMHKKLTERADTSKKRASKYVFILQELFRGLFSLPGYQSPFTTGQLKFLMETINLPILQLLFTKYVIKCYSRSVFETENLRSLFLQPALDSKASICYRFVVYVLMHVHSIVVDCTSSKQRDFFTWLRTKCFPDLEAASVYSGFPTKTHEYIQLYLGILKTKLLRDDSVKTTEEISLPQPKQIVSQPTPCIVEQATVFNSNQGKEHHLVLTPSYIRHFADQFEQNKSTDLRNLHAFIQSYFSSKTAVYIRSFISTSFNCAFTLDTQRQASNIGSILSYMIELDVVTKEKVIGIFCSDALPAYSVKLACGAQGASAVDLGVTIIVKALFRSSETLSWMATIVFEVPLDNREQFARMMLTRMSERYTKYFPQKLRFTSSKDRNIIGRRLCKSFLEDKS